jgi:hypothetical protein
VIGIVIVLVAAGVVVAAVSRNNRKPTPRATIAAATATGCDVTSVAEQQLPAVGGGTLEVLFEDGSSVQASLVGATHSPIWP